jgi:Flp pilus assembly protein TadG
MAAHECVLFHLARLALAVRRLAGDRQGAATIEVALTSLFMVYSVMNVADISIYAYTRMQVQNAAQMGAQAVYEACGSNDLPATSECADINAAVLRGIQSTALGNRVTLKSGSPTEGWYCINASNALQYMSAYNSKPTDCSGAGMAGLQPGDYIKVETQYTFSPLFPTNTTVGSLLNTRMSASALVRLE